MSKPPKDPRREEPEGGRAGRSPTGRKKGTSSGRASKAPPKEPRQRDKPDERDK